jgi:AcrR family transcriptional regulator
VDRQSRSFAKGNAGGYYQRMAEQTNSMPTVSRTRRRGKELEDALYDATLAELAAVGYGGLTMEGIAARARTGKAALYRRWSSKHDLVQAALLYALPPVPEPRTDRSARENLLAVFSAHCDVLAGKTAFPGLAIINQLLHEPELRALFADAVVTPRLRVTDSILQAGVANGEINAATLTPYTARVGPALINQQLLLTGAPPNKHQLAHIVDTVIAPSAQAHDDASRVG